MIDVINYFYTIIQRVVNGLFQLEIVDGVSLGWLSLAILVTTAIVSFFYHRIAR